MTEDRYCVKVKFFAQTYRLYGVALILMGDENSYIQEVLLNLSSFSINYNQIHKGSSLEEYYTLTADTKETQKSHRKNYFLIRKQIETEFSLMEQSAGKRGMPKDSLEIEEDIRLIVRHSINDKKVVVFASVEKYNPNALQAIQAANEEAISEGFDEEDEEEEEDNFEEDFYSIPSNAALINCSPVVSPVGGVPLNSLREGDRILVLYGVAGGDFGSPSKDNPPAKTEKKAHDIREATVVRYMSEDSLEKLLVSINETTYGRIEEAESFNVKLLSKGSPIEETAQKGGLSKRIIILLIVLIILLLGAIFILIMAMQ